MKKYIEIINTKVPLFKKLNDSFTEDYPYIYFGNFALFFLDVFQLNKYKKLIDRQFESDSNMNYTDVNGAIDNILDIIEEFVKNNDNKFNDILFTTFFESIDEYCEVHDVNIEEFLALFREQTVIMYSAYNMKEGLSN